MTEQRLEYLADVAEMYYEQGMTQQEVAQQIGVTRSMVSRLLDQARAEGIIEIRVHRPLRADRELEAALEERFGLQRARVVILREPDQQSLVQRLGSVASQILMMDYLAPNMTVGLSWGTAVSALVRALEAKKPCPVKVVQMIGSVGGRYQEYDGLTLVQRLAQNLGGQAFYLNAPVLLESAETAKALLKNSSIRETLELACRCDLAVLGVGSTDPALSSFYLAGHLTLAELKSLQRAGAVGDVCGHHFDIQGHKLNVSLHKRMIVIPRQDLFAIPVRLGVAGGPGKVPAILGALRGHYVTALVTDSLTAEALLQQDAQH